MKKFVFSAALLFAACAVSAQESVVKEAKSAKSDPVKAAQILEPALVDPSTANDPETWKLAGDLQKSIYDDENMKLYLPGGQADTAKLYSSMAKMFEYYTKCDETEQAKVKSGELKKPKLRKKLASTLASVRPNLTNAGSDAFNAGNYESALKFFGLYVDAPSLPMFADATELKNDTLVPLIANYAALAANTLQNEAAVIKYAEIGKTHKEEGFRSLMCLAEVYGKGEKVDSTKWLSTVQEGVKNFPQQDFFIGNLMDYYIQKRQIDAAMSQINELLAVNETAYLLYVKGVLQYEKKDYEGSIATMNKLISMDGDLIGEAYAKIADCYFFPAQAIVEENATLSIDDPKYSTNENQIKEMYEKAKPFYEKSKAVKPDQKQLWGQPLLNIYWKLNKADYESLAKELGY